MKINHIKTIKELPLWFKLESYNKAKELNIIDWYEEFTPRLNLRKILNSINNLHIAENEKKSFKLQLPHVWELIQRDGLVYSRNDPRLPMKTIDPDLYFISIPEKAKLVGSPIVSSMVKIVAYGSGRIETPEIREKIGKNMQIIENALAGEKVPYSNQKEAMEWLHEPFDDFPLDPKMNMKDRFAYAKIDLCASDEQIKKNFAAWLTKERTRRNYDAPKRSFNEVDFNSWHESAVLPYLDLTFWAELEGAKISQHVIAQAIFLDAYAVGADFDPLGKLKTTKKKAEYLMQPKTMQLLELQMEEEEKEQYAARREQFDEFLKKFATTSFVQETVD